MITSMIMDPNIPEDSDAANRMPVRQRTLDPSAIAAAAAAAAAAAGGASGGGAPPSAAVPPPSAQPLPPKMAAVEDYRTINIRTFDSDDVGGCDGCEGGEGLI
jgi:hypothetical protein